MKHLPYCLYMVSLLFEILGKGRNLVHGLPKVYPQIIYLQRIRPQTGQKAGSGRIADRHLAMCVGKHDALLGKFVDIGADDMLFAITFQFRTHIVGSDK
jgi:hypothetical protein